MAEEYPLGPVQRGPPGLLASLGVAPDFDVPAACGLGGGTVARFPGQRHRARQPRMVQAAFGRPGHARHPASRTQIRMRRRPAHVPQRPTRGAALRQAGAERTASLVAATWSLSAKLS